jgi:hypothetical protein
MDIGLDSGTQRGTRRNSSAGPNLWVAGGAGIVAAIVALYLSAFSDPLGALLYLVLVVAPLLLIALLAMFVRPWRQKWLTITSAVTIYLICTAVGLRFFPRYRFDVRWVVTAKHYKQEILNQSSPANGQLRHAEWDGWGFAPSGNTTVYVVYDPSDSLLKSGGSYREVSLTGLPCDVSDIQRLQQSWYAVVFYTDTDWEHCPPKP